MSFQEALEPLSRDERFKATVYAMNSLLIQKGVYAPEEFEQMFKEWAEKERTRTDAANRTHLPASIL
jgi:ribosomal protein L16 Arg81 hydroxylase